jgi:hypothetical protein
MSYRIIGVDIGLDPKYFEDIETKWEYCCANNYDPIKPAQEVVLFPMVVMLSNRGTEIFVIPGLASFKPDNEVRFFMQIQHIPHYASILHFSEYTKSFTFIKTLCNHINQVHVIFLQHLLILLLHYAEKGTSFLLTIDLFDENPQRKRLNRIVERVPFSK